MSAITFDSFSGGLSDGNRIGVSGSFLFGQGLNFKDNPDQITANKAAVKNSGTTVTDLVKWISNDGTTTYFYGDAGKIYKRTSGGTWSLLRTVANSGGQGLCVYDDYLYYTQDSQIGRYGALSGAPSFTDNWQTSLNGTTEWRPIYAFRNFIAVGNGRYLAHWDGATWTAQKITFPPGWFVHCIGEVGSYLAIGVNDGADPATATRGLVFLWDGTSSTYNDFVSVDDGPINAILGRQNKLFIWAGHKGNIYVYAGGVQKIKKVPFVGDKKTIYTYPGTTSNWEGMVCFGLAGGTSATVYREVYSWGRPNKNYPDVLNIEFPISTGTVKTTDVDIGAVKAIGNSLYIGWKDDTDYGVDLVSTTTNQLSVTWESRIFSLTKLGTFRGFRLFFKPLASGETLTLKYKADLQSSWQTIGTATYASDGAITHKFFSKFGSVIQAMDIQFQITLAGTSTMPTVYKLSAMYDEITLPLIKLEGNQIEDFEMMATSTSATSVTLESPIIEMTKQTSFTRFKLYFEKLVAGDSITLQYKNDQATSWTTIESAVTYTNEGAITYKLLNAEFRATDIQFKIILAGTSAIPVLTKLVVDSKSEGNL